jgi:hypothetical protein
MSLPIDEIYCPLELEDNIHKKWFDLLEHAAKIKEELTCIHRRKWEKDTNEKLDAGFRGEVTLMIQGIDEMTRWVDI